MKSVILVVLLATLFVCIITLAILYLRKRDTKLVLPMIGFIILAIAWGFIFDESIQRSEFLTWLICFGVMSIIIILGYLYQSKKSRIAFMIAIILGAFWLFTFCTEVGSVRLAIALKGYPKVAYSVDLVENSYMRKNNISYYIPSELIDTETGTLSFFECSNYGFFKITKYCD